MLRVISALATLLIGLAGLAGAARAEPYRPARDDQVLERLPPALTANRSELRKLQQARSSADTDLERALTLADFYIKVGRGEADPRLYSYAEGVLRRWSDTPDPPASVLLRRATIRQFRHDFDGALDDLNALVARGQVDPQVWLLKASVLRIQGRYAAAMDSCAHLTAYADQLVALTCAAEIQSLGADSRAALADLTGAVEARSLGPVDGPSSNVLAWSELVLAGIAEREGASAAAEKWYRATLALTPDDARALAAYADFLLDQQRPADARRLLEPHQNSDGLLLRLALAESRNPSGADLRLVPMLQSRFDAARARGDRPHLGDEARFELVLRRRPDVAFRYARENWRLLREPRDALILAQSALASGDPGAAKVALGLLSGHDVNDRRLVALRGRLMDRAS